MWKTVPRLGTLLLIVGVVWMLQGVGFLPGSFMTGQIEWAGYGALAATVGVVLVRMPRRRLTPATRRR